MIKLYIGCAGWECKDWIGLFYPKKLPSRDHLEFYAKFFNVLEINSTFYNLPSEQVIMSWSNAVPDDFLYLIKMWRNISHDFDSLDFHERMDIFFERFRPLEDKIFGYLLQLPPWFKHSDKYLEKVKGFIRNHPSQKFLILEFRDNSWFKTELISQFYSEKNTIISTTYLENLIPFYYPNQQFYYIRLIGDRQLKIFNRIQRDQNEILDELHEHLSELKKTPKIFKIFIIVNNHFTGFAPETANLLKKKFGLPYKNFSKQKSITEFF